VLIKRCKHY